MGAPLELAAGVGGVDHLAAMLDVEEDVQRTEAVDVLALVRARAAGGVLDPGRAAVGADEPPLAPLLLEGGRAPVLVGDPPGDVTVDRGDVHVRGAVRAHALAQADVDAAGGVAGLHVGPGEVGAQDVATALPSTGTRVRAVLAHAHAVAPTGALEAEVGELIADLGDAVANRVAVAVGVDGGRGGEQGEGGKGGQQPQGRSCHGIPRRRRSGGCVRAVRSGRMR
jgi:hypothetical protein